MLLLCSSTAIFICDKAEQKFLQKKKLSKSEITFEICVIFPGCVNKCTAELVHLGCWDVRSSQSGVQVVDEEHHRPSEPRLLERGRVLLRAAPQHRPGEVGGDVEAVGRLGVAEDVEVEVLEGVRLPEPPLKSLECG